MKHTSRTIRVSIPYIQEAMASKDEFDALAFCVLVKLKFTDSIVRNPSVRRLKEIAHMGCDKIKRVVRFCTEHGMATIHNGIMTFHKLFNEGGYYYKFKHIHKKGKREESSKRKKHTLTVTKIKDMMRKAVMANHIKIVENIREQALLTINPRCVDDYRKGKRILRKLSVWGCNFFISNKRLATIAGCSISKARNIKRKMIEAGEIERGYCNTLVYEKADEFSLENYRRYMGNAVVFLFEHEGKIYRHMPNVYSYKGQNIGCVLKNNK